MIELVLSVCLALALGVAIADYVFFARWRRGAYQKGLDELADKVNTCTNYSYARLGDFERRLRLSTEELKDLSLLADRIEQQVKDLCTGTEHLDEIAVARIERCEAAVETLRPLLDRIEAAQGLRPRVELFLAKVLGYLLLSAYASPDGTVAQREVATRLPDLQTDVHEILDSLFGEAGEEKGDSECDEPQPQSPSPD